MITPSNFSNPTRKLIITAIVAALIIVPFNPGQALTFPNPSRSVNPPASLNFENLKNSILKLIDSAIAKLNDAEAKIQANVNIDPATKQAALDAFNKVEEQLLKYKAQVQTAATLAELRAINQQIIQYLKDNKDVIKQNIQNALVSIGNTVLIKVDELINQAEELLKLLKITCKSETATIEQIEAQLVQLETGIDALTVAIQAKNSAVIKAEIQKIAQLSQELVANLEKVAAACLPPPSATPSTP